MTVNYIVVGKDVSCYMLLHAHVCVCVCVCAHPCTSVRIDPLWVCPWELENVIPLCKCSFP